MTAALAILAAGASTRLGEEKVTADLGGHPVVGWSIASAIASDAFDEIVVVTAPAKVDHVAAALRQRYPRVKVIAGGATRTASCWAALDATRSEVIAIHDAARPFASPSLFTACVEQAERLGSAVAGIPLADTVRRADEAGTSLEELEREGLWQIQTPQVFRRELLERARVKAGDRSFTDDAAAVVASGERVRMAAGEKRNLKITTSEDLAYARELVAKGYVSISAAADLGPASKGSVPDSRFRKRLGVGVGYDVHRLAPDRRLVLGGVAIEHPTGLLGHSDGDVLVHAIMDALLGAAGLGDLGKHFPSDDPAYTGADSIALLRRVAKLLGGAGLVVANVDATVIAEAPRLASHTDAMRERIASAIGADARRVSVKATTNDGLGALGAGQAIAAIATALVEER